MSYDEHSSLIIGFGPFTDSGLTAENAENAERSEPPRARFTAFNIQILNFE
jgi:hypothetical protein